MSEPHGTTSRRWDPERSQHEAQSPAATRPEGDGVFVLLETVRRVAVRRFSGPYAQDTRGAPPFDPAMLVCLVLSASGVGVLSSRKSAVAGARNRAFRAMVGQDRPDCRPISAVRTRPLEACNDGVGQVGRVAGERGLVRGGPGATEGTTRQGHASRHTARRDGEMPQAVERLREEREAVVTQAAQQDAAEAAALGSRRGEARPAELARREERLVPRAAA